MSQNPPSVPAPNDHAAASRNGRAVQRARLVLLLAAVTFAGIGLLALFAVLLSAWVGADPWPGFVTAAYFCLPLGFFFMIVSLVVNIILRGRS